MTTPDPPRRSRAQWLADLDAEIERRGTELGLGDRVRPRAGVFPVARHSVGCACTRATSRA